MAAGKKPNEYREKMDFIAAVCEAADHARPGKFVPFTCPICGGEGLCVKLGPGGRRGACHCGRRFIEPRG